MERIYHRDESGQITTTDAKDWTIRAYLDAHPTLDYADTETLLGWPDAVVDWYATGGADCGTQRAVGFAVAEQWRLVEHVQHQRKRAGLSPAQTARHRDLSVFALTEMVQRLAVAKTEAEATAASAVDAEHAALLADSDAGADQDWQGERTVWTFADDSLLVVEGPNFWAESAQDLDVSYYCVVEDRVMPDGAKVHQCPISPKYATPEQAETALHELAGDHPDAHVCCITRFCGDADARASELADIH